MRRWGGTGWRLIIIGEHLVRLLSIRFLCHLFDEAACQRYNTEEKQKRDTHRIPDVGRFLADFLCRLQIGRNVSDGRGRYV